MFDAQRIRGLVARVLFASSLVLLEVAWQIAPAPKKKGHQ